MRTLVLKAGDGAMIVSGGADAEAASVAIRILDEADALFYAHGVQAVGIDRIRDAAGVSLKRLYRCYPSKATLVEAYLRRRDRDARAALAEYVAGVEGAEQRVLSVFDWLYGLLGQPGFRGCAFNNAFGELGPGSEHVVRVVHAHKRALRAYFLSLAEDVGLRDPEGFTTQLVVLFDGAITVGSTVSRPEAAIEARAAARTILAAAPRRRGETPERGAGTGRRGEPGASPGATSEQVEPEADQQRAEGGREGA